MALVFAFVYVTFDRDVSLMISKLSSSLPSALWRALRGAGFNVQLVPILVRYIARTRCFVSYISTMFASPVFYINTISLSPTICVNAMTACDEHGGGSVTASAVVKRNAQRTRTGEQCDEGRKVVMMMID